MNCANDKMDSKAAENNFQYFCIGCRSEADVMWLEYTNVLQVDKNVGSRCKAIIAGRQA